MMWRNPTVRQKLIQSGIAQLAYNLVNDAWKHQLPPLEKCDFYRQSNALNAAIMVDPQDRKPFRVTIGGFGQEEMYLSYGAPGQERVELSNEQVLALGSM